MAICQVSVLDPLMDEGILTLSLQHLASAQRTFVRLAAGHVRHLHRLRWGR